MEFENYGFMNYFGLRIGAITAEDHEVAVADCSASLAVAQEAVAEA
jgi:hypothetical protein